jgi:hypothetical protein
VGGKFLLNRKEAVVEQQLEERQGCLSTIWLIISTGFLLIVLLLRMGWEFFVHGHGRKITKSKKHGRERG